MAKLWKIEAQIRELEGFDVVFLQNGRDVRGDKKGFHDYPFERMAKENMTVSEYKARRLEPYYDDYEFAVLFSDGTMAYGQTKLQTVRDTYGN